jgi:hypothetical protein
METIKRVGRYTVAIELFTDVTAGLRLVVAPEGEELPTEEELAAAAEAEAGGAGSAAAEAPEELGAPEAPEELGAPDGAPDVDWPAPADETGTGFAAAATVAAEDAFGESFADEPADGTR